LALERLEIQMLFTPLTPPPLRHPLEVKEPPELPTSFWQSESEKYWIE
jgi:hypothetical protein